MVLQLATMVNFGRKMEKWYLAPPGGKKGLLPWQQHI